MDQAAEWLVKLQSGSLTHEQEADFDAWLKADELHMAAYIEVERQWDSLAIVEQLYRNQEQDESQSTGVSSIRRFAQLPRALAASVALFLCAALTYVYIDYQDNKYLTQVGEQAEFILSDSSRIHLNTGSLLHTEFDQHTRRIILKRGEVFFDIAKDAARPFVVDTGDAKIQVMGTRFNVLSDAGGSRITVVEGIVGIVAGDKPHDTGEPFLADVTLTQNQQIVLAEGKLQKTSEVDSTASIAWRSGKLVYNGEPFHRVLSDISRYFDGEIQAGDETLNSLEVLAVLQLQDKAATIKALEETFGLAAVEVSDKLTLLYPND